MTNSIKNVIVIGATGLVGKSLLKQLNELAECEKITAVVRHENAELKRLNKVSQFVTEDFLTLTRKEVSGYSHAFSCLGTTMKKAGSKENFYRTDFVLNAHFADLFEGGSTHYLLVSAIDASESSRIFYSRVKGELENYVRSLELSKTSIIQPSLLLGERSERRNMEELGQKLYRRFASWVPDTFRYKPVTADEVAHTLVLAAQNQQEKLKIYDSLRIHKDQLNH